MAVIGAGAPHTGMMALVQGGIFARTSSGSRVSEASTPAITGSPSAASTAVCDAIQVQAGTLTASPEINADNRLLLLRDNGRN